MDFGCPVYVLAVMTTMRSLNSYFQSSHFFGSISSQNATPQFVACFREASVAHITVAGGAMLSFVFWERLF